MKSPYLTATLVCPIGWKLEKIFFDIIAKSIIFESVVFLGVKSPGTEGSKVVELRQGVYITKIYVAVLDYVLSTMLCLNPSTVSRQLNERNF